ncbi:MAG: rod-binding protein [Bdellovibrio sp.]|nr:rod-binding protein [Bdellovibrio sp.]
MSDMSGASGNSGNFKAFDSKFMGRPVQKSPEQKLRDVSDMYEKHFLREMMKAMRSTVHEGGFVQSNQAEKIFKEQLDDHYVEKWGERGGIGLSDMIYKQLMDKFGVMMGIKAPVAKPQGPLPFDAKSEYRAQPFQHPGKKQAVSYRIDVNRAETPGESQANKEPEAVKAPWDGVLLGKRALVDNQTMLEIEHDNGLKSQMVFKGGVSKVSTGQKLQAGDTLGFLSPEAKSLYWTVEPEAEPGPETVSE